MKRKAVLLSDTENPRLARVYDDAVRERLAERFDLLPEPLSRENGPRLSAGLQEVEIAFSTWGLPDFSAEELAAWLPRLRVLFYGAGSVQRFARVYFARGCRVVSSWAANAVPVAEYTAAQIVLANKGYFQSALHCKRNHDEAKAVAALYPGNYDARVGLIGAGMIGRQVIALLRPYRVDIDVYDPFLPDARAAELGVRKTELAELFATCDTISNHLANLPATVGLLNGELFRLMKPHATFINTGRGAQVVEAGLVQALRDVPTRTAVLDVTAPEPAPPDSPLRTLPNVVLTPHIAGSMGRELARLGHYVADEAERYCAGQPLMYEVTPDMLATMA